MIRNLFACLALSMVLDSGPATKEPFLQSLTEIQASKGEVAASKPKTTYSNFCPRVVTAISFELMSNYLFLQLDL